ncbi:Type 1 glutamine amidotransferase-like domain-containing protein [Candidatus Curtissbacteria bacterium]|nr:Type 1 glutamine amidotransferase-like domain-containing protein [Candidatus Curtissbacteria bacterium]
MKLLLTSGGITNKTIKKALADLVGKPFNKTSLAFIPTAANVEEGDKSWLIEDLSNIKKLKLKSIDIVDISALPKEMWLPRLEAVDILFFSGGVTPHLMYWLKKSGLADLLPKLLKTRVYAGISAGSMVTNPTIALGNKDKKIYYEKWFGYGSDEGLGLVNFYVRPHLNSRFFPNANNAYFAQVAKNIKEPIYALDDNMAIKIVGSKVEVVGEGKYLILNSK